MECILKLDYYGTAKVIVYSFIPNQGKIFCQRKLKDWLPNVSENFVLIT